MRKTEQIFTLLLLPVDALTVILAFIGAYFLRSNATFPPVIYIWPFEQYIKFALIMTPVWLVAFSFAGLYSPKRQGMKEFGQILVGASLGAMAVVLWVFLNRSDFFSRLIVFYVWIGAIILVSLGRIILNLIHSNLYLFGLKKKKIIFIGNLDKTSKYLLEQIQTRKALGYEAHGIISQENNSKNGTDLKYLGTPDNIEEILKKEAADEAVLISNNISDSDLFRYMRACQEQGIVFKAIPTHAEVGARTLRFDAFAGVPIIEFKGTPLDSWGIIYKRAIDFIGALVAIIVLSPVLLAISIIIKLTSKGPVLYRNIRVGNKGDFETLKFRTMFIEHCTGKQYGGSRAEAYEDKLIKEKNIKQGSAVYKISDDPRVTSIGRFLRKTSLDELPQFFNVLKGNMSIIGPRPHQPKEVENYTQEQRKLLMIKPGISGLAQISGRSDLSFDEEADLDIFYLENWSIWLDFYIMIKTFGAVFKGKGTY